MAAAHSTHKRDDKYIQYSSRNQGSKSSLPRLTREWKDSKFHSVEIICHDITFLNMKIKTIDIFTFFSEQNKLFFTFPRSFVDLDVRSRETRLCQSPRNSNI
jgi:hypothetical protein